MRNLERLKAKIAKIPAKVKANLVKADDTNADEMVGLAQRLAPRRTGALAASIHKEDGPTEISKRVVAGDSLAFYARFVEFGTSAGTAGESIVAREKKTFGGVTKQTRVRKVKRTHPGTRAQPFFFPAYRSLKKRMASRRSRAAKAALKG